MSELVSKSRKCVVIVNESRSILCVNRTSLPHTGLLQLLDRLTAEEGLRGQNVLFTH